MRYLAIVFLLIGCFQTARAQDAPIQKDPTLATILSFFVAGSGQVYAGKTEKGVSIFLATAATSGLAAALAVDGVDTDCTVGRNSTCRVESDMTGAWVMIGAATAIWLHGVLTAAGDARAYNRSFAAGPTMIHSRPGIRIAWTP